MRVSLRRNLSLKHHTFTRCQRVIYAANRSLQVECVLLAKGILMGSMTGHVYSSKPLQVLFCLCSRTDVYRNRNCSACVPHRGDRDQLPVCSAA